MGRQGKGSRRSGFEQIGGKGCKGGRAECREESKRIERRWDAKVRLGSKGWKAVKE